MTQDTPDSSKSPKPGGTAKNDEEAWRDINARAQAKEQAREARIFERVQSGLEDHDCFKAGAFTYRDFHSANLLITNEWDFSIRTCVSCGRRYLHAFCESIGHPRSGRWIFGEIDRIYEFSQASEQDLIRFLLDCPKLYFGGSHWRSDGAWASQAPGSLPYVHLEQSL